MDPNSRGTQYYNLHIIDNVVVIRLSSLRLKPISLGFPSTNLDNVCILGYHFLDIFLHKKILCNDYFQLLNVGEIFGNFLFQLRRGHALLGEPMI